MSNAASQTAVFQHALIVGASGGIGAALIEVICDRRLAARVTGWSRRPVDVPAGVGLSMVDITDEASIAAAAGALDAVDLVMIATGVLQEGTLQPEKTIRTLDPAAMARAFAVNTIGPALVAKHVAPLLPRDRRAVLAALSARVGSIGDNRLGGWYSYRASKAALNQIIRTLSVELALKNPHAIVAGLHPGTVDTGLSKPFQGRVPEGALSPPRLSAGRLIDVVLSLEPRHSGRVLDWRGDIIPD